MTPAELQRAARLRIANLLRSTLIVLERESEIDSRMEAEMEANNLEKCARLILALPAIAGTR